jgi:hypothetical protein
MPNPENILPHKFKKGQSGNPAGRPKEALSLTTILRKRLEENDNAKAIKTVDRLLKISESVDDKTALQAIDSIIDRIDGKSKQTIEQNNTFNDSIQKLREELPDFFGRGEQIDETLD